MNMNKSFPRRKLNTGDRTTDKLYQAVIDYIEKRDGKALIIGGVAVVDEGRKFNYGLMVRITGKKPKFPQKETKE